MSDYTEHGAVPVEDAVVDDPPTVDEVLARQRAEYPDQAATSVDQPGAIRPADGSDEADDGAAGAG